MIRPLHPIDMPSYLSFAKNACYGEGVERCERGPVSLRFLNMIGRSLSLDGPRHTWIYTQDRTILGLVAVKSRRGLAMWEIDRLVGRDSPDTEIALGRLLEHLAVVGGKEGVQKIFLRLPSDSALLPVARRAGFFMYTVERLYRSEQRTGVNGQEAAPLRLRRAFDHHALFQHYSQSVPARVRQAEGMTLQEWRWFDGWQPRRHWHLRMPRGRRDYVLDEGGRVSAWVQVDVRNRLLQMSLDSSRTDGSQLDGTLTFALSHFPATGPLYCPVREYQSTLEGSLRHHGFEFVGEYNLTVKLLAVRVGDRRLVPVGA